MRRVRDHAHHVKRCNIDDMAEARDGIQNKTAEAREERWCRKAALPSQAIACRNTMRNTFPPLRHAQQLTMRLAQIIMLLTTFNG